MPYRIVIELSEEEVKTDDIRRIANYLAEVLETMGYTYSVDCLKDEMKVMMGLEDPQKTRSG